MTRTPRSRASSGGRAPIRNGFQPRQPDRAGRFHARPRGGQQRSCPVAAGPGSEDETALARRVARRGIVDGKAPARISSGHVSPRADHRPECAAHRLWRQTSIRWALARSRRPYIMANDGAATGQWSMALTAAALESVTRKSSRPSACLWGRSSTIWRPEPVIALSAPGPWRAFGAAARADAEIERALQVLFEGKAHQHARCRRHRNGQQETDETEDIAKGKKREHEPDRDAGRRSCRPAWATGNCPR